MQAYYKWISLPFLSWAVVWSPLCRGAILGWSLGCRVLSWFSQSRPLYPPAGGESSSPQCRLCCLGQSTMMESNSPQRWTCLQRPSQSTDVSPACWRTGASAACTHPFGHTTRRTRRRRFRRRTRRWWKSWSRMVQLEQKGWHAQFIDIGKIERQNKIILYLSHSGDIYSIKLVKVDSSTDISTGVKLHTYLVGIKSHNLVDSFAVWGLNVTIYLLLVSITSLNKTDC